MQKRSAHRAVAISTFLLLVLTTGFLPVSAAPTTAVIAKGLVAQNAVSSSASDPFSDVPSTHLNAEAIAALKAEGVIQGYPDKTFRPANSMNRAEFAKIVVGALTKNPQGQNCFSDVKNQWFAPFVCEGKKRGILSGYNDGNFKPDANINFSEAAKIVTKAFKVPVAQNAAQPNTSALAQPAAATTSASTPWYQPYVTALGSKKAIPLTVNFFDEKLNRDEMAEMVWRLKDNVTDKTSQTYDEMKGQSFVTVSSCQELQDRYDAVQPPILPMLDKGAVMDGGIQAAPAAQENIAAPAPAPAAGFSSGTSNALINPADTPTAVHDATGAASDYSSTNLQVAGVDEADVIKNDGKYIYLIKGNTVRVVEAYPADHLEELVSFQLGDATKENFYPSEMYVDGDHLTVVGNTSYNDPAASGNSSSGSSGIMVPMIAPKMMPIRFGGSRTKVFVVNIADRTKPSVERTVEFDGNYNTSRKIGGTLYLVANSYPQPIYYGGPIIKDSSAGNQITKPSADSLVPKMKDSKDNTEQMVVPCNQIRILPKPQNFNFIITAAIPLTDLTKSVSRSVIVGNSENLYASANNLYLASTDWGEGYYRPNHDYGTAIYKFALGDGTIQYKDKGIVPGQILNQFSMDEDKGYFRIATTTERYGIEGSNSVDNNLYVLDENMNRVGKLEHVAPGEKIYSTRFMGDRAYMVTFKSIDPLFALDLKDPQNPKIAGELKIPGYSTYLQPYDENHLIGFGNEVDENIDADKVHSSNAVYYTAVQGLKIGLFDVTDLNHPKEMFHEDIGARDTTSEVLNNHKALLFDKTKNLLAFPVTVTALEDTSSCSQNTYNSCPASCQKICVPSSCTIQNGIKVCTPDCSGQNSCMPQEVPNPKVTFDGLYVYNIDLINGFQLKGKITHYSADDQQKLQDNGYADYNKTIQRALYIGDNLYTVSMDAIKANALSDLSEKKAIELSGSVDQIYYGKPVPLPM